jgi:hypothetical protein
MDTEQNQIKLFDKLIAFYDNLPEEKKTEDDKEILKRIQQLQIEYNLSEDQKDTLIGIKWGSFFLGNLKYVFQALTKEFSSSQIANFFGGERIIGEGMETDVDIFRQFLANIGTDERYFEQIDENWQNMIESYPEILEAGEEVDEMYQNRNLLQIDDILDDLDEIDPLEDEFDGRLFPEPMDEEEAEDFALLEERFFQGLEEEEEGANFMSREDLAIEEDLELAETLAQQVENLQPQEIAEAELEEIIPDFEAQIQENAELAAQFPDLYQSLNIVPENPLVDLTRNLDNDILAYEELQERITQAEQTAQETMEFFQEAKETEEALLEAERLREMPSIFSRIKSYYQMYKDAQNMTREVRFNRYVNTSFDEEGNRTYEFEDIEEGRDAFRQLEDPEAEIEEIEDIPEGEEIEADVEVEIDEEIADEILVEEEQLVNDIALDEIAIEGTEAGEIADATMVASTAEVPVVDIITAVIGGVAGLAMAIGTGYAVADTANKAIELEKLKDELKNSQHETVIENHRNISGSFVGISGDKLNINTIRNENKKIKNPNLQI